MKATNQMQSESRRYRAFISYSHKDKATAKWLHASLERYTIPKNLVGKHTSIGEVPMHLAPIFRDQDELPASGNLGVKLQEALTNSMFLIVICSPAAAQSKWVNEEIRQFKMIYGNNRILALIADGVPSLALLEKDCFPLALKHFVSATGDITSETCEPIAADMRKWADGKRLANLKLISGLTGLQLDDLVQRDSVRRGRKLILISGASFLAAFFSIVLALYANNQRIEANSQRQIAELEATNALAVSDFLVDSFASASSWRQNPNDVTARSILDNGAQRISTELKDQPLAQSRLSTTIAQAFSNLGLFDEAIEVLDNIAAISGIPLTKAYQLKANALYKKGEFAYAMETIQLARRLAEKESAYQNDINRPKVLADLARIQGDIYYELGQHTESLNAYDLALLFLDNMPVPDKITFVKVLQAKALLLSDIGQMKSALSELDKAMDSALESVDSAHVLIGMILLAKAQVNFLNWDLETAKEQIHLAISNMQNIYENDNPNLADAISMKGQILHAMGELDEADAALTEAVDIYTKVYGGRHHLSGIAEIYLALIAGDRKDLAGSLAHFDEAKLHYDEGYGQIHANHGDLMVNRASVLASMGEVARAKVDCTNGMVILRDTLGADAPFTQQLQEVCDNIYAL